MTIAIFQNRICPVHIIDEYISTIRDSMPEPLAKRSRFIETYAITEYMRRKILAGRSRYAEEVVTACMDSKLASNWIQTNY